MRLFQREVTEKNDRVEASGEALIRVEIESGYESYNEECVDDMLA